MNFAQIAIVAKFDNCGTIALVTCHLPSPIKSGERAVQSDRPFDVHKFQ
ncbi:hypothetical protein [Microcoleus sp. K5-D4]